MDTQTLINLGGAVILAGMGWLARELWGAVKDLRKDLHIIEVALPSNYIRKDEFQEGVKELKDICRQIFERLENKADK
jgi:hypothetical protein